MTKYKITVEKIEEENAAGKRIYEQVTDSQINLMEIITAFNKSSTFGGASNGSSAAGGNGA